MKRFTNQPLRDQAAIAIFGSFKVGNFVASIPLLKGLRMKYPFASIDYYGSTVTESLEGLLEVFDFCCCWDDSNKTLSDLLLELDRRIDIHQGYDLCINLDGFNPVTQLLASSSRAIYVVGDIYSGSRRGLARLSGCTRREQLLADPNWNSKNLALRYSDLLDSGYIGNIWCSMAYVPYNVNYLKLASSSSFFRPFDIIIHCNASRQAKLWPSTHWIKLLSDPLFKDSSICLVGTKPSDDSIYNDGHYIENLILSESFLNIEDLRGQTSLLDLVALYANCKLSVSVDSGPLHLSIAAGAPTIAILGNDADGIGASPVNLWLSDAFANLFLTFSSQTCTKCQDNRFKNDECINDAHICQQGLEPNQVLEVVAVLLRQSRISF